MASRTTSAISFGNPKGDRARRLEDEAPMRILVLGNFGACIDEGRQEETTPTRYRARFVDVDNIDDVLCALAPSIELTFTEGGESVLRLNFRTMEDFHPDELYRRLPFFNRLRELRRRLLDPDTFDSAAAELRNEQAALPKAPSGEGQGEGRQPPSPMSAEDDASTFKRLLGSDVSVPIDSKTVMLNDTESLIRSLVAPHIISESPHLQLYLDAVDDAAATLMRAILGNPAFRRLESAWRSLAWLVTSLETDESLQVALLDVSKETLRRELSDFSGGPLDSDFFRQVFEVEGGLPDGQGWSLMVGDYGFDAGESDAALLAALGTIGSAAVAPFVSHAEPTVVGSPGFAFSSDPTDWIPLGAGDREAWRGLRESASARWVCLALPRILLRLPYGADTEPCDSFAFDEMHKARDHEAYLWGNPGFAIAIVLGRAFRQAGWNLLSRMSSDLEDLPAHVYLGEDGETLMQACAEAYLTERAGQAILEKGCVPVLSYRHRNAVRLGPLRTLFSQSVLVEDLLAKRR